MSAELVVVDPFSFPFREIPLRTAVRDALFEDRAFEDITTLATIPAAAVSSAVLVVAWSYFILTGSIATIWPMFGIANQLLATVALAVGSTILLREARRPAYAWVTLAPLVFVAGTTITAALRSLFEVYLPMAAVPATATKGAINAGVTGTLLICVLAILSMSALRWRQIIAARRASS